jgi:thiol:disulfide interchange protein
MRPIRENATVRPSPSPEKNRTATPQHPRPEPQDMKVVITFLCVAVLALGVWLVGRSVDTRELPIIQWVLAGLAVAAVFARWRIVARRRQRQKLQELRDSALW